LPDLEASAVALFLHVVHCHQLWYCSAAAFGAAVAAAAVAAVALASHRCCESVRSGELISCPRFQRCWLSGIICTVLVYAMMLLPNATSQNSLWGVFCGSVGMCVSMLGEQLFVPGPYAVAAAV